MKATIPVPSNLSEITLRQYKRFLKLEDQVDSNNAFFLQKMVEIFCGIDLQDAANIRYRSLIAVVEDIQAVFQQESKFIQRFKMNGVEYGFIPVLDDISLGEYVDLDNYISDKDNLHKAMAVLYRPITHDKDERYDIEEYKGTEYADKYLDMPLDVVLGSYVFFYHLGKELAKATLNSLEIEETPLEYQQALEENGAGIKAYMHSLKEILRGLDISQN